MSLLVVEAPMQGTIVSVDVRPGDSVRPGQQLLVIESMKMEHVVNAEAAGPVTEVTVAAGATVNPGDVLTPPRPFERPPAFWWRWGPPRGGRRAPRAGGKRESGPAAAWGGRGGRGDEDDRRPEAVARRRRKTQRTTRENVDDLVDPGSFVEYGPLVIAAQRRRRPVEELIERTPADGLVAGVGTVDGHRTVVMSYDYTVLAGTQGLQNHRKKDRLFELAEQLRSADRVLHRGRRRAAGRHRRRRRVRPRLPGLQPVRRPERPRAAGGHQLGPLLRRQRRHPRVLRRDHRHRRTPTSAWAARP